MLTLPSVVLRRDYLKDLIGALKKNEQVLGKELIAVPGQEIPQPGHVKNWLIDYDDYLGAGKHSDIERTRYLFESSNTKKLTDKERAILDKVLKLYELLKLTPRDLGGLATYSFPLLELEKIRMKGKLPVTKPLPKVSISTLPKPAVILPAPVVPPVEIPKPKLIPPKPFVPPVKPPEITRVTRPEVISPKIKPAPEFKPVPPRPVFPHPAPRPIPPEIKPAISARPPRITAAPPLPPTRPIVLSLRPKSLVEIISIDDIKKLAISDFRSYAEVAKDSAMVITEKINTLLVSVSPLDRIKALSFWKESDLYKLYIEMGRESMAQDKSIKELAEERKAQIKPYLTEEEFEAVTEISGAIG
jgi:hypothetical protein